MSLRDENLAPEDWTPDQIRGVVGLLSIWLAELSSSWIDSAPEDVTDQDTPMLEAYRILSLAVDQSVLEHHWRSLLDVAMKFDYSVEQAAEDVHTARRNGLIA